MRAAPILLPLVLTAIAPGQVWHLRAPSLSPSARDAHAMVYDAARGVTLLFAGDGRRVLDDTWEWDGSLWTQLQPAASPPRRSWHAMAYDGARSVAVMFSGAKYSTGLHNDTWLWDGLAWTQAVTPNAPSPRAHHAMVFDERRQVVVLFGGANYNPPLLDDTWEWDGVVWRERRPAERPPGRAMHGMTYDQRRGVVLVFGGLSRSGPGYHDDTWTWDGTRWARVPTRVQPPAMTATALEYDPRRDRTVLVPGFGRSRYLDTWEFDGADWAARPLSPQPGTKQDGELVYDTARETLVLFGGRSSSNFSNETWEYAPAVAARLDPIGTSCAGSTGTPALVQAAAWELPWLGSSFTVHVTNVPAALAVGWVGSSSTSWVGGALPAPLAFLGAAGCSVWVSPEVAQPLPTSVATVSWTVPVPAVASLIGLDVFLQALVVDPAANPAGFTTTNGLRAHIGQR